jgi:hypothetical protein
MIGFAAQPLLAASRAPASTGTSGAQQRRSGSGQVHCEALEIGERAVVQGTFVCGAQDHARRLAGLERLLPTGCAEAPAIAGPETAKAELRHRRRKIVAPGSGKLEKSSGHDHANGVAADVLSPGVAAAVSKEPRHRCCRAGLESLTKHVAGCAAPPASIAAIVPEHFRLPNRPAAHQLYRPRSSQASPSPCRSPCCNPCGRPVGTAHIRAESSQAGTMSSRGQFAVQCSTPSALTRNVSSLWCRTPS